VSRTRALIVAALVLVFVLAGAIVVYSQQHRGGQNLTFNLTVTGGATMSPSQLSAHQNDNITIYLTSDTAGGVHLHDYDIIFDTKPGQTVSHTFKADRTCSCDIEWESTSHPLGTLTVSP
jgi:hypothetical protein